MNHPRPTAIKMNNIGTTTAGMIVLRLVEDLLLVEALEPIGGFTRAEPVEAAVLKVRPCVLEERAEATAAEASVVYKVDVTGAVKVKTGPITVVVRPFTGLIPVAVSVEMTTEIKVRVAVASSSTLSEPVEVVSNERVIGSEVTPTSDPVTRGSVMLVMQCKGIFAESG
jgi:hypothetical protein